MNCCRAFHSLVHQRKIYQAYLKVYVCYFVPQLSVATRRNSSSPVSLHELQW